jgi:two-component system, LytTR family, sensor kinase
VKPPTRSAARFARLLWVTPLLIAVALGTYAKGPEPGPQPAPGTVRMMVPPQSVARQPAPPPMPDLSTTLYQLGVGSVSWYAVLLAFPLLLFAARKLKAGPGRWIINSLWVVGTLLLGVGLTVLTDYFVTLGDTSPERRASLVMFAMRRRFDGLPWLALLGIVGAIEWRRRAVHGEIERERLRAEASEQRLLALMVQVRPHFLFNTLQAISTLLHRDPRAADEMLGRLSELLRSVLEHRDRAFARLSEEIRLTVAYLEIARVRFGDRVAFEVDVPQEMHSLEVPLFILQPLVENALTHGIGRKMSGGRVTIRAFRRGERLRIEVEDDGPGAATDAMREGIGLSNTRERLAESFGENHAFGLVPRSGAAGMIAFIEIPWRVYRGAEAEDCTAAEGSDEAAVPVELGRS